MQPTWTNLLEKLKFVSTNFCDDKSDVNLLYMHVQRNSYIILWRLQITQDRKFLVTCWAGVTVESYTVAWERWQVISAGGLCNFLWSSWPWKWKMLMRNFLSHLTEKNTAGNTWIYWSQLKLWWKSWSSVLLCGCYDPRRHNPPAEITRCLSHATV